jgi:hypothetical protein
MASAHSVCRAAEGSRFDHNHQEVARKQALSKPIAIYAGLDEGFLAFAEFYPDTGDRSSAVLARRSQGG